MKEWEIYRDYLEADKVINVPIAKHHSLSRITLGLKNLMGVMGGNRGDLHNDFARKLVDIDRTILPTLTIIDAYRILTANGPVGGNLAHVKPAPHTYHESLHGERRSYSDRPLRPEARRRPARGTGREERRREIRHRFAPGQEGAAGMTAKIRRVVQILFLLLFLGLFLAARYPYTSGIEADLLLRISPLIPLFDALSHIRISLLFLPALIILALTPFLGSFFCGWICPLGTTIDAASKVVGLAQQSRHDKMGPLAVPEVRHPSRHRDPRSLLGARLGIPGSPVDLQPGPDRRPVSARTLFVDTALQGIARIPEMESAAYAVLDPFKAYIMPEPQARHQELFWIALMLVGILGLPKRYRAGSGAGTSAPPVHGSGSSSQFRMFERLVGDACPVCNKCQIECKMNAIPGGNVHQTSKVECIDCFNCGAVCPPEDQSDHLPVAVEALSHAGGHLPPAGRADVAGEHRSDSDSSTSVSRTGSRGTVRSVRRGRCPRPQFADKCIRCLECVRICRSNGGCLQPDAIHSSVEELWLPVAVMREGYCEYNCNLCGQVCPTDAIVPLTLEEKQHTPIGLAHFRQEPVHPVSRAIRTASCAKSTARRRTKPSSSM